MRGTEVEALLARSSALAKLAAKEDPGVGPPPEPQEGKKGGPKMSEVWARVYGRPRVIPRVGKASSMEAFAGQIHDDEAARARLQGREPLLTWEKEAKFAETQARMARESGFRRESEYQEPYPASAGYRLDHLVPDEDLQIDMQGGPGAPDWRYPGSRFPGGMVEGSHGAEDRYYAELIRHRMGSPPLEAAVNPLQSGYGMPTYLEQALMALKAGGVQR